MFKTINKGTLPLKQTKYSVGFDVYSNENILIKPKTIILLSLGILIDLSWIDDNCDMDFLEKHYFGLYIRSSLVLKKNLILPNSVGIIDIDYPDELKLMLYNISDKEVAISNKDRVGQLILHNHHGNIINKLYSKKIEKIRDGGFGSTNIK